jgi:RND family efflux transporter MFP subunit
MINWERVRESARRHRVATVVVLAIAAFVLWRVLRPKAPAEAEVQPVVAAQTVKAEIRSFPVTLSVLGTVSPRPGRSAQLAAPGATRVMRVFAGVGDRVAAGQPLIALDESIWAAQTAQAEAAFLAGQQAYDRATRLVTEGVLPRKDAETAAADLAQRRAALVEARQRQSLAVLRSPIAGVVTQMNASLSQAVDVSQVLAEVMDPTGLEVLFHLSPQEAGSVPVGAAVRVTSGPDSSAIFVGSGTVSGINAEVDTVTGGVDVRATIVSPARVLKVGESVTGTLTIAEHPRSVVIPAEALVPADTGVAVFVVDAQSVAHLTPVTVGARNGKEVEIVAGLKGGETIVASGAYGVADGSKIKAGGAP